MSKAKTPRTWAMVAWNWYADPWGGSGCADAAQIRRARRYAAKQARRVDRRRRNQQRATAPCA